MLRTHNPKVGGSSPSNDHQALCKWGRRKTIMLDEANQAEEHIIYGFRLTWRSHDGKFDDHNVAVIRTTTSLVKQQTCFTIMNLGHQSPTLWVSLRVDQKEIRKGNGEEMENGSRYSRDVLTRTSRQPLETRMASRWPTRPHNQTKESQA